MINHPTFSPPSYSSYPYFPSTNYLAKPMPLMGNTNSNVLSPPTFLLPTDQFFRNQTYPSPPPSTSSSTRINTNNPTTQYQNGNQIKPNNEQSSTTNDSSKNQQTNLFPTPIRTKTRYYFFNPILINKADEFLLVQHVIIIQQMVLILNNIENYLLVDYL